MAEIGEQAPDFELLNQDGKTVKLSDFRGKKVILFAYPKADTPGCTIQACGFRDNFPNVETANAVVLGISPDTPEELHAWKDKINLPYDLLADPERSVLESWGVWGEQTTSSGQTYVGVNRSHWVIDENGAFIDIQIGISPQDSVDKALAAVGG